MNIFFKEAYSLLQGGDDALEANQIALEGVRGIKVVSAYSLQGEVLKRYLMVG